MAITTCMHSAQADDGHISEDITRAQAVQKTIPDPSSGTHDRIDEPGTLTPYSTRSTSTSESTGSYYSCLSTPTRLAHSPAFTSLDRSLKNRDSSPDHSMHQDQKSQRTPSPCRSSLSSNACSFSRTTAADPPTSSALHTSSLPQSRSSRSWPDSSCILDPSAALTPTTFGTVFLSVEDMSMRTAETKTEPKPLEYTPTNNFPPYFEDDFTAYLDKLLAAVLEDQNQDQAYFRRFSYSSFTSETQEAVITHTEIPVEQIRQDSQMQTQISEYMTSWMPTEIIYPPELAIHSDIGFESGSRSCSCSECSSAWISRTTSITHSEARAVSSFYEPIIDNSRYTSSESSIHGSATAGASDQSPNLHSAETSRSQTRSISSVSQQAWTPISPRNPNLASLIYGYDQEQYTCSENENEEASFDIRSVSSSSAGFSVDDTSRDRSPAPTLASNVAEINLKRRLSFGREEDQAIDDDSRSTSEDATRDSPPFKKRKLRAKPARSLTSIPFSATQPASLRRGLSLRSIDDEDDDIVIPKVRPLFVRLDRMDLRRNFYLTSLYR